LIDQLMSANGRALPQIPCLFCLQGSISPVTWLLLAEIFPLRIRGLAISLTTFVLWLMNSLVGSLFPVLATSFGIAHTFLAFAAINVLAVLFSWRWLPETRGKSLEELEQQFMAEDWTRLRRAGNLEEEVDEESKLGKEEQGEQKQQDANSRNRDGSTTEKEFPPW
jgi:MFS family permease